jgi:cohesin loading factor subunit SCC2
MDQNGHPSVQVVINGLSQPQQAYGQNVSLQSQPRSLSVDEALQYSSMSSAPVFGFGLSFP